MKTGGKNAGGCRKPDPVTPPKRGGNHSSRRAVADALKQPTRSAAFPKREQRRAALKTEPIRPCTGRGLPSPAGHPAGWWALTPPFHPYPRHDSKAEAQAVSFLWPYPWGRPRSPLATSLPYGVRTFLCGSVKTRSGCLTTSSTIKTARRPIRSE